MIKKNNNPATADQQRTLSRAKWMHREGELPGAATDLGLLPEQQKGLEGLNTVWARKEEFWTKVENPGAESMCNRLSVGRGGWHYFLIQEVTSIGNGSNSMCRISPKTIQFAPGFCKSLVSKTITFPIAHSMNIISIIYLPLHRIGIKLVHLFEIHVIVISEN